MVLHLVDNLEDMVKIFVSIRSDDEERTKKFGCHSLKVFWILESFKRNELGLEGFTTAVGSKAP